MVEARDVLRYEVRHRKAYITLNRPEAMNALNDDLRHCLHDAFEEVKNDDDVLLVVLTGAGGRAFSAGTDLKEMSEHQGTSPAGSKSAYSPRWSFGNMLGEDDVNNCAKPVIAAIDGHCLAAGFEVALYCDIRIATIKSTFGLPEPRRSLLAGPGLINLSRMIPLGQALRMQLTGSPIGAQRAYELGLIQELAADRDELFAKVEGIAEEILECAPLAVQYIKRIVKDTRSMPVEQAWKYSEMFEASLAETEDAIEGPRAFAEKRKPNWKMR